MIEFRSQHDMAYAAALRTSVDYFKDKDRMVNVDKFLKDASYDKTKSNLA